MDYIQIAVFNVCSSFTFNLATIHSAQRSYLRRNYPALFKETDQRGTVPYVVLRRPCAQSLFSLIVHDPQTAFPWHFRCWYLKVNNRCWQDVSGSKAWQPEHCPGHPHGRRKESTPTTLWLSVQVCIHIHTNKVEVKSNGDYVMSKQQVLAVRMAQQLRTLATLQAEPKLRY